MTELATKSIWLRKIENNEDFDELSELLAPEEVWRNLQFTEAPEIDMLYRMKMRVGQWTAFFIHALPSDEVIGLVIMDQRKIHSESSVELDIAISDKNYRKKGLSTQAMALVFDEYLLGGLCETVWGWIDSRNKASIAMVESMDLPIVDRKREGREMADGPVTSVEVVLGREDWVRIRPQIALALGLPALE